MAEKHFFYYCKSHKDSLTYHLYSKGNNLVFPHEFIYFSSAPPPHLHMFYVFTYILMDMGSVSLRKADDRVLLVLLVQKFLQTNVLLVLNLSSRKPMPESKTF